MMEDKSLLMGSSQYSVTISAAMHYLRAANKTLR